MEFNVKDEYEKILSIIEMNDFGPASDLKLEGLVCDALDKWIKKHENCDGCLDSMLSYAQRVYLIMAIRFRDYGAQIIAKKIYDNLHKYCSQQFNYKYQTAKLLQDTYQTLNDIEEEEIKRGAR